MPGSRKQDWNDDDLSWALDEYDQGETQGLIEEIYTRGGREDLAGKFIKEMSFYKNAVG